MKAGNEWQCRKHPARRSGGGVCPCCLRDRLLRLCPSCARVLPCPCPYTSCASPSSSSSSAASGVAVGPVRSLIEREHRMERSRSVAGGGGLRKARAWGWPPFWKAADRTADEVGPGLPRSSSVSATAVEAKTAAAAARWGWHFPSPLIKAFRHRRSSSSVRYLDMNGK